MGLQVALVDDPQAVRVAQVEEGRVRRVVRGADGVDVVPLHQQHVRAHGLDVQGAAAPGMPLVPVDALEQHRPAVDLDQAVLQGDGAEPDAQGDAFAPGGQDAVVQARGLRGPRLDGDRDRLAGGDVDGQLRDGDPAGDVGVDAQGALAGAVVVGGVHEEVPHAVRGAVQQGDVTEDARQPPLVLVLQVRARRPLVHPDGEDVAGRPQQVPDRELVRQAGALELAEFRAVQPDAGARLDAVEAQDRVAGVRPAVGEVEGAQVVAGGVLGGDARGIHREGVEVVGVDGRPVALEDPVAGDGDRRPGPGVVPGRGEGVVLGAGGRRQPEAPVAVQGQPGRVRGVPGARREDPAARCDVLDVAGGGGGGTEGHRSP
ncbi:hypothetical protein GCM10020295_17100 [Streptomyces cinereospinus]